MYLGMLPHRVLTTIRVWVLERGRVSARCRAQPCFGGPGCTWNSNADKFSVSGMREQRKHGRSRFEIPMFTGQGCVQPTCVLTTAGLQTLCSSTCTMRSGLLVHVCHESLFSTPILEVVFFRGSFFHAGLIVAGAKEVAHILHRKRAQSNLCSDMIRQGSRF